MSRMIARSRGLVRVIVFILPLGAAFGLSACASSPGGNVLTENLFEPLNGVTTAKLDINAGTGNLTIDRLTGGEPALAAGTLQYIGSQSLPDRTLVTFGDQANLTLSAKRGGGRSWLRLPWAACNGATEWLVHLNPSVSSDIRAHSDGGNVRLDLSGMAVTAVTADTGGGNMEVVLPDNAAGLSVTAKTGGGNVTVDIGKGVTGSSTINASSGAGSVVVNIPMDTAARIYASTGMGKATVDPRFAKTGNNTYESANFAGAANRVEITVQSGMGNVTISTK